MRAREFKAARLACVEANREAVEHHLQELYRLMGWPQFSHIIYAQNDAKYRLMTADKWRQGQTVKVNAGRLRGQTRQIERRADDPWKDFARRGSPHQHTLRGNPYKFQEPMKFLVRELLDLCPNPHVPVVLEKPLEVHFNEAGEPHNLEGPAIIWRDGSRSWWINGVRASRRFVEQPPTVAYINKQQNAERKRLLIERYGEERYLSDMKAELRHEDETGKLWRIPERRYWRQVSWRSEQFVVEALQFVQVVNSTPEKDGSYNTYFLCVPPAIKTAREAVAWTFRIPKGKTGYKPKVQT